MRDCSSQLRIIVLGYMVRGPMGGMAWHHLQYVMGLAALGHDVYFVEHSDDYASCYDPSRDVIDIDPAYGLRFTDGAFRRVGLADRWAYFDAHTSNWLGPRAGDIAQICRTADMLMNVSGVNPLRPWFDSIDARVLIDTDPAFTQIRHLNEPQANQRAQGHNRFFTFGENIGRLDCTIPDDGFPWQPTRQPVVLDAWPVKPPVPNGQFTTVMHWDSYPAQEYGGRQYGMKSASFEPYLKLPATSAQTFQLAVGGANCPRDRLSGEGWNVIDSRIPTQDPWTYQAYLQSSKAEFSVAKHGYVATNSGWFSERSAVYLASGRPVVVQNTGFTDWIPSGRGLLAFQSPEEALDGIEAISQRHVFHAAAARELATTYFDSRKVLSSLIERAGTLESTNGTAQIGCRN